MTESIDPRLLNRAAGPGRVRGIALDLWGQGKGHPERAGVLWREGLRQARALHSNERRLVQDALFGMVRTERWLGALVGEDAMALWLGWLVRQGLPAEDAAAQGVDAPFPRVVTHWNSVGHDLPVDEALALRHSLPLFAVRSIQAVLGDETGAFLAASDQRAPVTLRTNARRTDPVALAARLSSEGVQTVAVAPEGALAVVGRSAVAQTAAYRDGWFEVQDTSSQRVAALVPATGRIIDACAGAGGKALAIAARGGRVLALDTRGAALQELTRRARRAGVRIETQRVSPDAFPATVADTVLIDAPCTGTGVLRRHPEHRWRLDPATVEAAAARQRELVLRALAMVKPGGQLIYATCSVLPEENEAVVGAVLAAAEGLRLGATLRTWPHRDGGDGFYAAVLHRA